MPLCCSERESIFGQSIEELLDNKVNVQSEMKYVPVEIQQFISYLSDRNGKYIKKIFLY